MESPVTRPVWSAVVLHPADDVAVALRPLEPGPIRLRSGDAETFEVRAAIPMGHKFALRDIAAGADVRKYGEVIGFATTAIARGTHVHVQNLRSRRARTPGAAPPSVTA
jgi:altronate dehydratase